MTENIARQPKGVPGGGEFTGTEPEPGTAPTGACRLAGISFHMGHDNVTTTSVNINGEPALNIWNPGDHVHSVETSAFEHQELENHDGFEAAESWAKAKHEEMAAALRSEMHAAVERSLARRITCCP